MSKLVMGYWDCPVCGSKEIRGDVTNCPSCGRARGDVQFYMKGYNEGETREEDERSDVEYLDEEQAKYVSKNPDWYCSFCNSLNSDNAKFCNNCGSSREDSESNYFQMLQKKKEREAAEAAAQPQVSAPQAKRRSPMTVFLVILFPESSISLGAFHGRRNLPCPRILLPGLRNRQVLLFLRASCDRIGQYSGGTGIPEYRRFLS